MEGTIYLELPRGAGGVAIRRIQAHDANSIATKVTNTWLGAISLYRIEPNGTLYKMKKKDLRKLGFIDYPKHLKIYMTVQEYLKTI